MTARDKLAADPRVTALTVDPCWHCPQIGATRRVRHAQWQVTRSPGVPDLLLCTQHAVAYLANRDRRAQAQP
jgi:hypothetical protein